MIENFKFNTTDVDGVYLIQPFCAPDKRGNLIKDYNINTFKENGIDYDLKEVFYTTSQKGVLRGLHFQLEKLQPKLVRCLNGEIYDVIVDLRKGSSTFGEWRGYYLNSDNKTELLIPGGFAHAYFVLQDNTIVSYKCPEVYYPNNECGLLYNDPDLNINWPFDKIGGIDNLIVSDKDKKWMSFKDYQKLTNQ